MRESTDIWNIPNLLTFFRIALIPVLVFLLLSSSELLSILSVLVFSIASITDWLDGYLARKMNIVTNLGKFLDPIADKLLIAAALVMLVGLGRVPAWMVVVIIGREIAVTGLRSIASSEGIIIAASDLGKGKMILQISALIGLLLHYQYLGIDFHAVGMMLLWVALALTAWSGFDYFYKFMKVILKEPQKAP
ncbi:MAG: CDP-diacylglycerol--glycerol-3-phosphate 3-phosphatidyltransferase [Deltaproteobacteria bacterium]|nr:CDP-diacylglycerol--glycerol-3-phosphate 3-phosphatidyltransferase [Deltaproteobacteria bacterium]